MRYATVLCHWRETELMPLNSAIAADPALDIEAIYYINPLEDGTYAELSRFRGDMNRLRKLLAESDHVRRFELPDESDGLAYLQYESAPLLEELMGTFSTHAIVVSWPIRFTDDSSGVELTLLGTESVLADVFVDSPAGVVIELERTGDYTKAISDPVAALTTRQREILETAIQKGYYRSPREATHSDLAEELDIAPGTVTEQLQRIEETLMNTLTGL